MERLKAVLKCGCQRTRCHYCGVVLGKAAFDRRCFRHQPQGFGAVTTGYSISLCVPCASFKPLELYGVIDTENGNRLLGTLGAAEGERNMASRFNGKGAIRTVLLREVRPAARVPESRAARG